MAAGTQVILGSGGSVGTPLASELRNYTERVRLFSRNPSRVNPNDELLSGSLLNLNDVKKATAGAETAYLCAGLKYNTKIWQRDWPVVMDNTIKACEESGTRLVFFDNMYMYGPECLGNMTEHCPVNPVSAKGIVRAQIAEKVLEAHGRGKISSLIARSADFYGPGVANSALAETVLMNLKKGKKAMWLGNPSCLHSYTYTPDAAKSVAILGNSSESWGRVWHVATSEEKITGEQIIEMIARELAVEPSCSTMGKTGLVLLSIFIPVLREIRELFYQLDRDYFFNSSEFNTHFGFIPTPYSAGIRDMVRYGS